MAEGIAAPALFCCIGHCRHCQCYNGQREWVLPAYNDNRRRHPSVASAAVIVGVANAVRNTIDIACGAVTRAVLDGSCIYVISRVYYISKLK
jgi:hypothetical protein